MITPFKKNVILIVVVVTILLLSGCNKNSPQKKIEQSDMEVNFETEVAQHTNQLALSVDGVEDSTSVAINRKIGTAVKVTGFDRWQLKSIREEIHKKKKDAFPDYDINVTSDKKLFSQLQQIEKEIEEEKVEFPAEVKDRFDKINESM